MLRLSPSDLISFIGHLSPSGHLYPSDLGPGTMIKCFCTDTAWTSQRLAKETRETWTRASKVLPVPETQASTRNKGVKTAAYSPVLRL
ncbi:hypothetical protein PoB_001862200 [Plakobranchus ocellatus]|uniref:Uncharacterized protein n=1 Tax=Plakobranchus ocellatus TaxID=259542 RepID=A0AAV3ZA53_9GAST|nr:hypothetical protein PoB_001862200 [Plakobranchus ocellatus]